MAFLISKRNIPMLRIRGLGLSLAAITLLHLYWISCQLGYVVGSLAPGDAEYWIMGTYFPFGIALFQAANARFLYVAKAQSKYAEPDRRGPQPRKAGIVNKYKRLDYTSKMLIAVGLGMVFQVGFLSTHKLSSYVANQHCSSSSLFSCTSFPASSTATLVFPAPKLTALRWSRRWLWARDGSGGQLASGNSSGPGVSLPIFCTNLATFTTLKVGDSRLSVAPFPDSMPLRCG